MPFSPELKERYPSIAKYEILGDDYKESHDGRETALLEFIYNHPSLSMDRLRGSPATILQAMDEFSAQTDFLINISWDKGGKVADLIKQDKPAVLVELGGYVGYSAILFGDAARQAGTEGVKLWSIEYDPLIASIAMNLIDLAGLSDIVKVVVGSATDTIRRLKVNGDLQKIDFWFLDHDEDLYVQEFKLCEELDFFPAGALVVADNVVRPGAPQYREYVRQHSGVESWGVPGLIIPGDFADELEVTRIR